MYTQQLLPHSLSSMRAKGSGQISPCWLRELPATRQMNAIDSRQIGQEQLQLCKQGEVIRGDVGMGAASDIVLVEPMGVQRTQHTQHIKQRLRVEDVVNDALENKEKKNITVVPLTGRH